VQVANLFPYQIKNRNLFYDRDHESVSLLYRDEYWDDRLRKTVEGWWINDEGTWICMLPELDWITNIFVTSITTDRGNRVTRPIDLTDKEFIFTNYYSCCYGFSGYEDDEFFTCHRVVDDAEKGRVDYASQQILDNNKWIYDKHGKLKKYVNAWEYLRDHYLVKEPQGKSLGRPLYDNDMKDAFIMGARNSFKTTFAAANVSHKFFTGGIRRIADIGEWMGENRFGIGAYDSDKVDAVGKTLSEFYKNFPGKYDKDGIKIPPPLYRRLIGSWSSPDSMKHEYTDMETKERVGSGSTIDFGCYKNNKKLFVGGRRALILYDEIGLEEDPATIINAEMETLRDKHKDMKIGIGVRQGTSGFVKHIAGVKEICYKPKVYDIYPIPNYWEAPDKDFILFMPDYYVNSKYKDPQGNTKIEDAYNASVQKVKDMIDNGSSGKDIMEYEQNNPNWPSQMFTDITNTILPADLAKIRLARIQQDGVWREIGELIRSENGKVSFEKNPRKTVIDRYNPKTTRLPKDNGWSIYEHPIRGAPQGLYRITYDTISADGLGKTDDASLVSIIVKKGYDLSKKGKQNNIVARWTGRLDTKDKNHDMAIMAAEYYGALILHEEDTGDFVAYCRNKKKTQWLAPTPNSTSTLKISGNAIYNAGIKVNSHPDFKMHGLELYNEWLTFPLNAYDEEIDRMFMNIDELDDELILDEIANFNSTGNFDNTSAMLIHMIWDRSIVEQKFEIKEGKSDRPNKQRELYEFARKNLGYKTTSYVG
jgi:hypothetical protein